MLSTNHLPIFPLFIKTVSLQFEVAAENLMPRQPLLVELLHEGIGIELLDIVYTRLFPDAFEEHHGTYHGRYTGGVAYALHAGLFVGGTVRTVVVDIIGKLLAVFETAYAATYRGLALVVLAEVLRIGQHGFEELQRHDFHAVVVDGFDAGHTYVLYHTQVGEILLPEGHPETSPLNGRIVLDQALQLFVMEQVALAGADVGIGKRTVYFEGFGFNPLAVFPIETLLGNFANVDFGIEVGGKGLVVIAGVAVDNIEILYLVEVMFGRIGGIDTGNTRVETAAKNGGEAGFSRNGLYRPTASYTRNGLRLWARNWPCRGS